MHVASLHIYPIKSTRGVTVSSAPMQVRGLAGDRRAMIVDAQGKFLTQRSHGRLAQIKAHWLNDHIIIDIGGSVFEASRSESRMPVTVWRDTLEATIADADSNARLTTFLGEPVCLVFMDDHSERHSNPDWGKSDVSFADGYPVLITNPASLEAMNSQLDAPVPMVRFRPNIVIDHDIAWAEDGWKSLQIGGVILDLVKPCTRCEMTNLDPETGEQRGEEVTRFLGRHRRSGDRRVKGVLFGWNAIARGEGTIRSGDVVQVLETRPPWPIA